MFSTMPHVFTPGKICCPTKHVFHSNIILGGRNSSSCFDSFTPAVYFLLKSQPPPIWKRHLRFFLKRRRKKFEQILVGNWTFSPKKTFLFHFEQLQCRQCDGGNLKLFRQLFKLVKFNIMWGIWWILEYSCQWYLLLFFRKCFNLL